MFIPPQSPYKPAVLIADDDPSVRTMLTLLISRLGFSVLEAVNGMEAAELFEGHAEAICAVILDLNMPIANGPQALKLIRKISSTVPVILTSGLPMEFVVAEFEPTPPWDYLAKPFNIRQLIQLLSGYRNPA